MIWRLNPGRDKRIKQGHPWVFSSDLDQSPAVVKAGDPIELRDANNAFLAYGYGNPKSLISFRVMSRDISRPIGVALLCDKLIAAHRKREIMGLAELSHRLCFAEADGLPGLIVDRYRLAQKTRSWVFVIQCSTAGMNALKEEILEAIDDLVKLESREKAIEQTYAVIAANDSKSRIMEGLAVEAKTVVLDLAGTDWSKVEILVGSADAAHPQPVNYRVDFLNGQKTGFFLDQRRNCEMLVKALTSQAWLKDRSQVIRVLDLCCYVGQWGGQLSRAAKSHGLTAEVTCVDSSQKALELAGQNVEANGGRAILECRDVLEHIKNFPATHYDVVICDPPAFIKKKKDIPTGIKAYVKLNREALRRLRPGGLFIACSCSGLLEDEEFRKILVQASGQSDSQINWLARGGHSFDHPQLPEFPEGTYLKSWMGVRAK